eukprot:CAMPEP_0206502106 /NCGR_PEP_ID=MMETSP0324_2-20121206/53784_1 /ASSEMBLY_ACC=CAM_ASM_000836 /TAXON_ID=2866 /ORGANISM="Crypthecodinium cohnii, Strain Seligo" /LENGTH=39 /DNA_ID= /DNA_START= /DNA_END= /DNA_ORIENTATION=
MEQDVDDASPAGTTKVGWQWCNSKLQNPLVEAGHDCEVS